MLFDFYLAHRTNAHHFQQALVNIHNDNAHLAQLMETICANIDRSDNNQLNRLSAHPNAQKILKILALANYQHFQNELENYRGSDRQDGLPADEATPYEITIALLDTSRDLSQSNFPEIGHLHYGASSADDMRTVGLGQGGNENHQLFCSGVDNPLWERVLCLCEKARHHNNRFQYGGSAFRLLDAVTMEVNAALL